MAGALMHLGVCSPKLDSWRVSKCCLVWWVSDEISVRICRKQNENMDPPLCRVGVVV